MQKEQAATTKAIGPHTRAEATRSPSGLGRDSLYRRVFESMTCGVMLIDSRGAIETVNSAAAELLDLDREALIGQLFAEALLANAHLEELNDIILAAMYDRTVGHQRIANVQVKNRTVPLSVETSYLAAASRDELTPQGVVAVFSDISEIERLRTRERALGEDVKAKHDELRTAYASLEERNHELATLLRKVQVVRAAASACVIALVSGLGAWMWIESPTSGLDTAPTREHAPPQPGRFITVKPTPLDMTITVPTTIDPRREVVVTSSTKGQIRAVHVQPGETVAAGQLLLDLDIAETRMRQRTAQARLLKAQTQMKELESWADGVDASKAKRAVTKARIALEADNNQLAETTFLVEQGLLPQARKAAAERVQRNRRLDLDSAEQDMAAVLAKGIEGHALARLELENAQAEAQRIDALIANATITAPIAGVVLRKGRTARHEDVALSEGATIEPGQPLLTLGDMSGISVTGRVDETDAVRIQSQHTVRITGPAFPGITLEGKVEQVSSQAAQASRGRLPSFEITAAVDGLDAVQRASVRLGMSASMEIVAHQNDHALMVPFDALDISEVRPRLRVRNADGSQRWAYVTTGITTVDSIEIRAGVSAGDEVAVP